LRKRGLETPCDDEMGNRFTRETMRPIEEMEMPAPERQGILRGNARPLLRLQPLQQ
jgi:hypothetical protein